METIVIKNEHLEVHLITYGAAMQKLIYKGVDVLLGYETLEEYQNQDANFGANCGRTANRIKEGKFTIDGKEYSLVVNNGPNNLHGGNKGFDKCFFEVKETTPTKAVFYYHSIDGEEGYPGNLDLYVTYELVEDTVKLNYQATTDQTTIVNLTNHSYFNLDETKSLITNHTLEIPCDEVYPVDADGLIDPHPFSVEGTVFDYRTPTLINIDFNDPNIQLGNGYDHFFILKEHQATLSNGKISMKVTTSYPGAQIYSANYLTKRNGKYGDIYEERYGICIEASYLPDSIHIEENPAVLLEPGKEYNNYIAYTFKG